MKTVREVIHRAPVWVNPGHTTETAVVLMRGHSIGALPVMDGPDLVGMVLYNHLLGTDLKQFVRDVMMVGVPTISPEKSVKEAAEVMAKSGISRLPVVENSALIGVVTTNDLLPELGRSYDPLTTLPWTDSLREWAIYHLRSGSEITILFFDLDQFGKFNRIYGHVIGDEVLHSVANTLREGIDDQSDFLCRYGGDEFCIATLRLSDEAVELATELSEKIRQLRSPSDGQANISSTYGISGGRRTRERQQEHYAAMLNNLINLASRDCMAKKPVSTAHEDDPPFGRRCPDAHCRLKLARVDVDWEGDTARVVVSLQLGSYPKKKGRDQGALLLEGLNQYSASASAQIDEEGLPRLIADTTIAALRGILPDGYAIHLQDVILNRTQKGVQIITIVGDWISLKSKIQLAGSTVVNDDIHRAVASAVLAAVNRILGPMLAKI
jgi:diguanylate cyclase (GGDEF)-like protein